LAVPFGMITASLSSARPETESRMPITVYGSSPRKIAGAESTRLIPSRSAACLPRTTTLSPRWSCPASKNRPVFSTARIASNNPAEPDITVNALPSPPFRPATLLTRSSPTSTTLTVPTASTPFNRASRSGASHGNSVAASPSCPFFSPGSTTTRVACARSNF